EFYIGVSLRAIDDALRTQFEIPSGRGVMVGEVVKGSPAETAGIKAFDIILALGDKPIESPANFAAPAQAASEVSAVVKSVRGRMPETITVTPTVRTAATDIDQDLALFLTREIDERIQADWVVRAAAFDSDAEILAVELSRRQADYAREVEQLRQQI